MLRSKYCKEQSTEMPTVPFLLYLLRFFIENTALRFFLIKYVFLKFRLCVKASVQSKVQSRYKSMYTVYIMCVCVCSAVIKFAFIHTLHYA